MFSLPPGNFGSRVNAGNPFTTGMTQQMTQVRPQYVGPDPSRSAYARGVADTAANTMRAGTEQFRNQYQQKAEQVRAADVASMRKQGVAQYGLQQEKIATQRQQNITKTEGMADLAEQLRQARLKREVDRTANITNLLFQGGLLTSSMGALGAVPGSSVIAGPLMAAGGPVGMALGVGALGAGAAIGSPAARGFLGRALMRRGG